MKILAKFCAVCLWLMVVASSSWADTPSVISEVRVRGNLRTDSAHILAGLATKAGEPYDVQRTRGDIRKIYDEGIFDDVVVEFDAQGRLTFVVLERPALRDFHVPEMEALSKDDVEKAITLKRREILRRGAAEDADAALRKAMQEKGYFLAQVSHEFVPVGDGNNQVDVKFKVVEGSKVRIRSIHVAGASAEDLAGIMKNMALSEESIWSWLTDAGTYKEADMLRDREWVRAYYLDRGYAEVDVRDPIVSVSKDLKHLQIDIPVTPGSVFRLGKITFSGDSQFSPEKLAVVAGLRSGEVFTVTALRQAMQALGDVHADEGYAYADVRPKTEMHRAEGTMDLEFAIHRGELVYVGRIEITGNTKTRDRVIRRDIRLYEGELFKGTGLKDSQRRTRNLNFFESVDISPHRRPGTNVVDLDVQVKEKPTGSFSFGAGYSSEEKVMGMASINQANLLGMGYQLSLDASLSSVRKTYSLTFNNPRLFDSDYFGGFDIYKSFRQYSDFDKRSTGFSLTTGTSINDQWSIRLAYGYDDSFVHNVSTTASSLVKAQAGAIITSSITPSISYDTRDNPWDAHRGQNAKLSAQLAGWILGGTAEFIRLDLDEKLYFPFLWQTVFTVRGRVGYIVGLESQEVPIYERYALGGISSLRGYGYRSVGPVDSASGEVIGGDKQFILNLEYVFPLIPEAKVNGVAFFDAGEAWDVGQRYFDTALFKSTGMGVRWISPMGPLRLEYGWPLDRRPGERGGKWEFSVGGFF